MAEQTVTLAPAESEVVTFEAVPHEAKTYQVSVDGLSGSFRAVAPPFDPWSYDFNGNGVIETSELLAATTDYNAGKITKAQLDQVTALWEATKPPPPFDPWSYDINGNGYIDDSERMAALHDYWDGIITWEQLQQVDALPASPPVLPLGIQVVDLDINNNGLVDGEDEAAFLAAYGSIEGEPNYGRQLDANFNGVIDNRDYDIFYRTLGKTLDFIRGSIKTGVYERLVWPDGWDAYLVALNKDSVQEFTGARTKDGWISIQLHPYLRSDSYVYVCTHFAIDTSMAAYKALGYGCLLYAESFPPGHHAYNMFWVGGDWHDLNNWYILEPQNGTIFCAAPPTPPSMYQTARMWCCGYVERVYEGWPTIHLHSLDVNYAAKTVDFGKALHTGWFETYQTHGVGLEEPVPDVFDRAYLVGV